MRRATKPVSTTIVVGIVCGVAAVLLLPSRASGGTVPFLAAQGVGGLDGADSIVTGDFNGDGLLDLAATSFDSDEVVWIESLGAAGFAGHTVTTTLSAPIDLAAGDIDCDGDLDLAIAANGADRVVWAENSAGSWSLGGTVSNAAPGVTWIALLDLEPDGDLDVLGFLSDTGEIVRWRSDGCSGAVWSAATIATGVAAPHRIEVGDLDGDGLADVLATDVISGLVAYWANPGTPGAWPQVTLESGWDGAYSANLGDLDGDGDLDVVAASTTSDEFAWWENPGGAGAWNDHLVGNLPDAALVQPADVDRDGDLDLLAASHSSSELSGIWENVAGDGLTWSFQPLEPDFITREMIAADFDSDGDVDVASATGDFGVAVYKNQSTASSALFAPQDDWATNASMEIVDAAAADLDGDGRLDVVFAESDWQLSSGHVSWYRNVGPVPAGGSSLVFANLPLFPIAEVESLAVGDIDEDGDPDLIVGGYDSATSAWYVRNEGAGASWTVFPNILPGSLQQVDALELVDLDGDSDLDLLSAIVESTVGPLNVIWWENPVDSTTSWTRHDLGPFTDFPNELRAVDVDADGDLDVLSGSEHWWRNNGGSPPSWTARTLPGSAPDAIATGDLDGDGDTDFAFTGEARSAGWYENNANGAGPTWIEHDILGTIGVPSFDFGIALADFDLDGDLDVAVGVEPTPGVERVSWIENRNGAWTESPIDLPGSLRNSQLVAGDFHRDGDADLLVVQRSSSAWDLLWNGGGQFAVETTDLSPDTLAEGGEGALFSLQLHHRGRDGDDEIELASLSLLFESVPGVPLTTDELGAIVSTFGLYRDDGSGVFEPGVDSAVVALGPRPLVDGFGSFSLADDVAGLQLAVADSPALFFLTAELAPDALDSGLSTLSVTHFERDGSFAENADFDTPLRAEHPEYSGLTAAQLAIVPGGLPFADGFESGTTTAWSAVAP